MKYPAYLIASLIYLLALCGCAFSVNGNATSLSNNAAGIGLGSGSTQVGAPRFEPALTPRQRRVDALTDLGYTPWQIDVIMKYDKLWNQILFYNYQAKDVKVFVDGTMELKNPK